MMGFDSYKAIEKIKDQIVKLHQRWDKIDKSAPIYTERLTKLTEKIDKN